jgi:signal transduction histidine kinase
MRAVRLALLPLGIAFGLAAERHVSGATWSTITVGDFAAGCALIVCGTVAWERRAESRVGALMSLAGFTWFLGTYWSGALFLHRGPLVHLLLSYPTGRLRSRGVQVVVAAAYVDGAIKPLGKNDTLTLVLSSVVAVTALLLFLQRSGPARRASAPALAATLGFAGVLALVALDGLAGWELNNTTLSVLFDLVVAGAAIALSVDLLRGRWEEAVVTRLVVDLGSPEEAGTLRARLASALGDPSLVVGYRLPEADAFVDETGRPLEMRALGLGRTVTPIEEDGEQIAVLVHDDALVADPKLVESVAAAARLAVVNARLQAEARSHAHEVEASRRRVVEAGDAQSRRLEAELRLGAERRLDSVATLLSDARSEATPHVGQAIAAIENDLNEARRELREFAQGVHPAALTDGGLIAGVELLAERSPVPVEIRGTIDRLPPPVEAALFFVCSEALANVAKHAAASRATVDVTEADGQIAMVVIDDGRGGADLRLGSGLTGLSDRIEALGGRLAVESPPGAGTGVFVELPLES